MTSQEEITVDLVQQILRETEKDSTIEVLPNLEVHELNDSFHAGSCLSKVMVKYTQHGDTLQRSLSLIVKVVTKGNSGLIDLQLSTFFPREIQMYGEILPRMLALLTKALPGRHTDFSPRVYYTRKTPSYLLALEDLTPRGFKPPKRKNGLDLKQCLLALRALARFHATSVIIKRDNESLFTLFDHHYSEYRNEDMKMMSIAFISMVTQKMKSMPEFDSSWADRLQNRFNTLHDDIEAIRKRKDDSFNVLIHGDFGIHNLMYRYSESSEQAVAVMLLDFQTCCFSSPVIDLHQFIFTSGNDSVIASHIDMFLREYHAELTSTMEALGVARREIISLDKLRIDFERVMPYGLFFATCVRPVVSFDADSPSAVATEDIANVINVGVQKMAPLLTNSYFKSLERTLPIFFQKNVF